MSNVQTWDFYFCKVEGQPASIMLNLALSKIAPLTEYRYLIYVFVRLRNPNEIGLTTQEEAENLYRLEDRLSSALEQYLEGFYVARNTTQGRREFYFYCSTITDYPALLEEVMRDFPEYKYSFGDQVDPEWGFFFDFLMPSPSEYLTIRNRQALLQLEEQGDRHELYRPVTHVLSFPSGEKRFNFLIHMKSRGYEEGDDYFLESHEAHSYRLEISRRDKVEFFHIENLVRDVSKIASQFEGLYHGWRSQATTY